MASRIAFLFSIAFLLLTAPLRAQTDVAEAITIEHGLSQGMIFDILQTRDGFLWMTTKDGLNRYDGYNFKVYDNNPFDPFSLSDNFVTALFEDSRGWLWVGTDSKGLNLFERRSGRFYHFPLALQRGDETGSFHVRSVTESPDGSIWAIQQGGGLLRIQIPASWREQLPEEPNLEKQTVVQKISIDGWGKNEEWLPGFYALDDATLSIFSTARQYLVDLRTRQAVPAPAVSGLPAYIATATAGPGGPGKALWVGDKIKGLYFFQPGMMRRSACPYPWENTQVSLQEDGKGNQWLMVDKRIWQLKTGQLPDFSKPDWVLDRAGTCIATDRNGNIWVGTAGYGLRKLNPKRQLFHAGAQGNSIWGLWRTPGGRYFWKLVSEMYNYDPLHPEAPLRPAFPELPVQRKMDMYIEPSGAFWLLGSGKDFQEGCLYRYNAAGRLEQTYLFPLHVYDYARLLAARDGSLWITGARCQLFRFEPRSGRFEEWNYGHLFGKQAPAVLAYALTEDGNGHLWLGTQEGLVKATRRGAQFDFQRMQADPHQPNGLNHNSVACLLPDPTDPGGVLWVGTKGGGINRLDIRTGAFQHLTTADGLPDKVIYGILPGNEDPAGGRVSLWCSTNRGLVRLMPRPGATGFDITTFAAAQGLQDNEFNTQAFYKAPGPGGRGGELLFGGVNGLNHFLPEAVQPDTTTPPVFLVGLRINHLPVSDIGRRAGNPLGSPLEYLRELELRYDQNNLSFEFSALDFTDPTKNRYRYRLVGLDPGWTEAGTHRFAHFTHLAPGRYTLLVQANNGEGRWQDVAQAIRIRVQPPWWRSGAAYVLYTLLLMGAVWWAYRTQIRRVQLRGQLAFEHREMERVKALEQMKTNFFSNVTHEFRTPLTLILEPVRRILAKTQDAEIRENARLVETNSQRLLGLVNQLLDMAKLESDPEYAAGLDLRRADFAALLRDVFHSFLPLAEQRGIRLRLNIPEAVPPFLFDQNKVERVLHNLLANALKFTPAGGHVDLLLRRETANADSGSPSLVVTVRDSGIGIPEEALDKVFERFYQVDGAPARAGEGTGIGLALSRELALQMGGGLSVRSEAGKGAEFRWWLPLVEGAAAPLLPPETEAPEGKPLRRREDRPSVLLIEDNAELRGFIKQYLAPAWDVLEASNGVEGLQKATELLPDLVISDIMMPLKDGYAVCDELKNGELTAHIPVILLSAKSAMDSKLKGLRQGADDYLTKPFNTDELLVRMENLLLLRRRLRERYARQTTSAADPLADAGGLLSPPDREFLRRFTVTLEQHLPDETIGVDDFAQKMAISRVQLHRKLKALTDRNVSDFVRDYRLDRAMAMLQNREGLVYEVASKVGFGSEKYFSRAFKEKFGVPPSQVGQS